MDIEEKILKDLIYIYKLLEKGEPKVILNGITEYIESQQKEIERLNEEMFLKDVGHQTTQNLWTKTLNENTSLKERDNYLTKELDSWEVENKKLTTDNKKLLSAWENNEIENSNLIEEKTTLKQTIEQSYVLLHKCNSNDANVDRAINLLKQKV